MILKILVALTVKNRFCWASFLFALSRMPYFVETSPGFAMLLANAGLSL